jgi:hypothetical protein
MESKKYLWKDVFLYFNLPIWVYSCLLQIITFLDGSFKITLSKIVLPSSSASIPLRGLINYLAYNRVVNIFLSSDCSIIHSPWLCTIVLYLLWFIGLAHIRCSITIYLMNKVVYWVPYFVKNKTNRKKSVLF